MSSQVTRESSSTLYDSRKVPRAKGTIYDRFWSKVDKNGPSSPLDGTSCWIWMAAVSDAGYGVFRVGGRKEGVLLLAHRFSYGTTFGATALQLDHRHTCAKSCVNPDHLRPVTDKQNKENHAGAQRNSKSGVRGVSWDVDRKKWFAKVKHDRKQIFVGRFDSLEEATTAVIKKRNELFTHNEIDHL